MQTNGQKNGCIVGSPSRGAGIGTPSKIAPARPPWSANILGSYLTLCWTAPALRACASVDIHVEVPQVDFDKLGNAHQGEPSRDIRGRSEAARERHRFAVSANGTDCVTTNADMGPGEVRDFCPADEAGPRLLCPATPALARMRK
jgi:hypothetical protein